jgi:hypothetical protein
MDFTEAVLRRLPTELYRESGHAADPAYALANAIARAIQHVDQRIARTPKSSPWIPHRAAKVTT